MISPFRAPRSAFRFSPVCLAHDATLLTRNEVDFKKVQRLRAENWLEWAVK